MPGTLFLVATPIGNLEDITLRGLRVLKEAGLVAAEDTRRTAKLLAHYGIATPVVSFHDHSGPAKVDAIVERLKSGTDVALVSDAGTPLFSDPGLELVRASIQAGLTVDPIPGACAPVAAAIASGFGLSRFLFLGFAPARTGERRRWLEKIGNFPYTLVFFESPYRIKATLTEASEILGMRQICVARELSKVHQEFLRGDAKGILAQIVSTKGEFTIVVDERIGHSAETAPASGPDVLEAFARAAEEGHGRRAAIAVVAKKFGLSSRDVYGAIEAAKALGLMPNRSASARPVSISLKDEQA